MHWSVHLDVLVLFCHLLFIVTTGEIIAYWLKETWTLLGNERLDLWSSASRFRRIHICGFIHMLVVGAIGLSLDIVCVSLIPMQLHKYIVRWVGREKGHYPFPLDRTLALIMSAIQISSHVLQKVFCWRACPVRCRTETTALLFRRIAWNGPHIWLEDILEWHVAE